MSVRASLLLLVGSACAPETDIAPIADTGSAARNGAHALDRVWRAESDQTDSDFGIVVASAGDVNGDGFDDVMVGAPRFDDGLVDQGKVFVYHGSPSGPSDVADWTEVGDDAGDVFGTSVASAGDVNGDGFDDVIVGALEGPVPEGGVYVYLGSALGLEPTPSWTAASPLGGIDFGIAVASAGDVNGDGFDDVMASDHRFRVLPALNQVGRVVVYLGSATGLDVVPVWELIGGMPTQDQFAEVVASAGDVNGDGFDDIAISEVNFNTSRGRVFVYHGSATGPEVVKAVVLEGVDQLDHFGEALTACDLKGDGFSDLLVGSSWSWRVQKEHAGRVFVYDGKLGGLRAQHDWSLRGTQEEQHLGRVLACGDVTGDGIDDLISAKGSYEFYGGPPAAFSVFPGRVADHPARKRLTVVDPPADEFAESLAVGDFDGNGFADVVAGAPFFENGEIREGGAFVYLGK